MGFLKLFQKQLLLPELKKDLFKLERQASIPELKELNTEPIVYNILGDLVTIRITKQFYSVQEPEFNEEETQIFDIIKKSLYEIINIDSNTKIEEYLEKSIRIIISELNLEISEGLMRKLIYYCYRDFIGLGKIEAILRDPLISEISYSNELLSVAHRRYGKINTNVMLNPEDILLILRKLAIKCSTELNPLDPEINYKGELNIIYHYNPDYIQQSKFILQKKFISYPSPIKLIKEKKISSEMFAFLWMILEERKNIFVITDTNIVNALSFFLPAQSRVFTNIKDYYPSMYTSTNFGELPADEDYALFDNYCFQPFRNILIASSINANQENSIICYTEEGKIKNIQENNINLFVFKDNKFLFNLNNSAFMNSRGNLTILMEEFKLRTKLLNVLVKANLQDEDFKKIILIYYNNPVAVLKKAGII